VEAISLERLDRELVIVGCKAVFADGTFVARRGTRTMVERLPSLVLVDRWKRIDSMPPSVWPSPHRCEMVPGDAVRAPAQREEKTGWKGRPICMSISQTWAYG
jgi:hypothetical protein